MNEKGEIVTLIVIGTALLCMAMAAGGLIHAQRQCDKAGIKEHCFNVPTDPKELPDGPFRIRIERVRPKQTRRR